MHTPSVDHRAKQYLSGLTRYRSGGEQTQFLARVRARCNCQPSSVIGVYENDPEAGDGLIVGKEGFAVCQSWEVRVYVPYASVADVNAQDSKQVSIGVECELLDGTHVFVPVLGSNGRFLDSMSFATFLMGVVPRSGRSGRL
jgi:hypothetical protein